MTAPQGLCKIARTAVFRGFLGALNWSRFPSPALPLGPAVRQESVFLSWDPELIRDPVPKSAETLGCVFQGVPAFAGMTER